MIRAMSRRSPHIVRTGHSAKWHPPAPDQEPGWTPPSTLRQATDHLASIHAAEPDITQVLDH